MQVYLLPSPNPEHDDLSCGGVGGGPVYGLAVRIETHMIRSGVDGRRGAFRHHLYQLRAIQISTRNRRTHVVSFTNPPTGSFTRPSGPTETGTSVSLRGVVVGRDVVGRHHDRRFGREARAGDRLITG